MSNGPSIGHSVLKLFVWVSRPFGLTFDYFDAHPWKSVERLFEETEFKQMYGGPLYISSRTAPRGICFTLFTGNSVCKIERKHVVLI